MELFQILDCSTLGTCCTDYGIVGILAVTKKIFLLIQFLVPFFLIIAGTIQFVQLTINPELKDGFRRVLNKFIAAAIIFMLPTVVDVVLTAAPETFSVVACWRQVKVNTTSENQSVFGSYVSSESNKSVLMSDEELEKLNEKKNTEIESSKPVSTNKTSAKQNAIVSYAKQFVNKKGKLTYKYKRGGSWKGEKPYTPTDCSGFVKGVIHHVTGVTIPRKAENIWKKRASYAEVISEKNRQAGDIIVYHDKEGYHVGLYTGHGKEIIHNKGTDWGVIKQNNYNTASKHGRPIGFLRVKGVKE